MGISSNQPDFALYTESSHLQQQFPIITKNKKTTHKQRNQASEPISKYK